MLELNASDERGISVVREKIKTFARETPRHAGISSHVSLLHCNLSADNSDGKEYPCPPYKLIILDEADSMTQDAQSALRRIMETYSRITRFCLVCNYVTRSASSILEDLRLTVRIIEPLASRCSKFRFRPLAQGSSEARIQMIANAEGVQADEGVSFLIKTFERADLAGTPADSGVGKRGLEKGYHIPANGAEVTWGDKSSNAYNDIIQ